VGKKGYIRKIKKQSMLVSFVILGVVGLLVIFGKNTPFLNKIKTNSVYIASDKNIINLFDDKLNIVGEIFRGKEVVSFNIIIRDNDGNASYEKIKYNNEIYYVNKENLTSNKEDIVKEKIVFVRTPVTLYDDIKTGRIAGLLIKGDKLNVIGYDYLNEEGTVNSYKIQTSENIGHIYSKYVVLTEEESLLNYEPSKYYDVHYNRGNRYDGGHAGNLDYFPVKKTIFEDNIMPEKVYALYLNSGKNVIGNVDDYIDFAKTTKINAFIVDIKDNEAPGYKSKIFEEFSPTNYKYANNSFNNYKSAIGKIKQAGFYVIGRITVFKDKYYVLDNPDIAINDSRTNEPYLHSNTYWPSPFQRKVWEFNVDLAKEAVEQLGFNEIQFDYVRFPDRTIQAEKQGLMLFKNDYNEEKAQAIQRFMMYACDELHKLNVYVSVDVFGESAYNYVTAYGQYWPAISNVVDVISGMPYPDHFNKYEFGFKEPVWTTPYELLYHWGSNYVMKRQTEIPTPAITRTWVQTYDVPNYKHPGGFVYGEEQIEAQIKALFDAGLNGGYMTWLSHSNLERYKSQVNVYSKEY
jgi:hypothetical protein